MKLPIIKDELTSNHNDYIFSTEYINNVLLSKICIVDNGSQIVIREIIKSINRKEAIKEEMMNLHNKILSIFFKALRNGDKEPEKSINIESDREYPTDLENIENKIFSKYINNKLDEDTLAILIAKEDKFEYIISDKIELESNSLEPDIEFSYNMINTKKEIINKTIGEINSFVFSYKDYHILYFHKSNIDMIIAISSTHKLANAMKIGNNVQSDILKSISLDSLI
jgi:hypothetical protein